MNTRLEPIAARARGASSRIPPRLAVLALILAVPCCLLFAIEVRSLRGPLYGVHEWRQGWTYSVAYAYVHEGTDFFHPKHAWRGALSGIVGMEVPIYPYVASLFMRVLGDAPVWGRLLGFVPFVLAFALQGQRIARLAGASAGLGYLVMVAFSPMALSEFRQWQPDPLCAALCVLAAVCLQDHAQSGSRRRFALGVALYSVALLVKSIAIAVLPAMFLFAVLGPRRPTLRGLLARGLAFAPALVALFFWDRWANELVQRYMNGVSVISIDHDPARMWLEARDPHAQKLIFLGLLENWVTHCVPFVAVVFGAVRALLRRETRPWALAFVVWLLGVSAISLAFSSRYQNNWYYMLLFGPPVMYFGAVGLGALFDVLGRGVRDPARVFFAAAIVVASALVAWRLREVPIPWDLIDHVAPQLAVHVRQQLTPRRVYWLTMLYGAGAGLLVAALLRLVPRLPQAVVALPLGLAFAVAMVIPYRDVRQTARFYTAEPEWDAGRVDQAQIRAAVDRFSIYRDLFLMNGANPGFFARALRVGFADDPGWIDTRGREAYQAEGVRFFLTFRDSLPLPRAMQGLPLLVRGERFALYCLDPKGCPERAVAGGHSGGLGGT